VLRSFVPRYNSCLSPSIYMVWLFKRRVAENLWSYGFGIGPENLPLRFWSVSGRRFNVYLNTVRGFRFFYPSKLAVYIKAVPFGDDEVKSIKSAGNV